MRISTAEKHTDLIWIKNVLIENDNIFHNMIRKIAIFPWRFTWKYAFSPLNTKDVSFQFFNFISYFRLVLLCELLTVK